MADETLKSFVEKWAINFNCNAEMNTANQALVLIRKLAEKLDTDGAGSSPVQPDWSQNDEAASDYIKNRPGGYTVNYPALNIEWDGVIGDRVMVDAGEMKAVKVSDEILKVERFVGGTLIVKKGDTYNTISITYETIDNRGNGIYIFGNAAFSVNKAPANLVNPETGAVMAVFPETGVYFMYMSGSKYVSSLALPAKSVIVPIPQKYVDGLEEGIILNSSTAGSTKKFKITVDDAGVISATEVT